MILCAQTSVIMIYGSLKRKNVHILFVGPELSINGIKADFTLEVKDEEGQSYYFWVIEDIGDVKDAEDIEKMSIEGLL